MTKLLSCILILAFAISCAGWGILFRRFFHLRKGAWPTTVVLGLATLVALGGLLNLLRLVSPTVMAILLALGLISSLVSGFEFRTGVPALFRRFRQVPPTWMVAWPVVLLVLVFTVVTQLPPSAYNLDDDLTKYFTHPMRMLQTGTVVGSSLSPTGLETMGGQAFIQCFVLAFFPIQYINAADAVFGLLLCLLLVAQLSGKRARNLPALIVGMAGVLMIEPQYVNVSALYLGSALILGIIALGTDLREIDEDGLPNAAAVGILYAALAALKSSLAAFAVLHVIGALVTIATNHRSFSRGLRWATSAALAASLAVASWLALHIPGYLDMLACPNDEMFVPEGPVYHPDLFSNARNIYGPMTIRDYTTMMIVIVLSAALPPLLTRKSAVRERLAAMMVLVSAVSGMAFYLLTVFSYSQLIVRYATPVAIAVAPATFIHTLRMLRNRARLFRPLGLVALLLFSGTMAGFAPSWLSRFRSALHAGTTLEFPNAVVDSYQAAYRDILNERGQIERLQSLIPEGKTVLAWIRSPFFLDFGRNPIVDFHRASLWSRAVALPRVDYVMFQYAGGYEPLESVASEGIQYDRRSRIRTYAVTYELFKMLSNGDTLFDDGLIRLVRLRS